MLAFGVLLFSDAFDIMEAFGVELSSGLMTMLALGVCGSDLSDFGVRGDFGLVGTVNVAGVLESLLVASLSGEVGGRSAVEVDMSEVSLCSGDGGAEESSKTVIASSGPHAIVAVTTAGATDVSSGSRMLSGVDEGPKAIVAVDNLSLMDLCFSSAVPAMAAVAAVAAPATMSSSLLEGFCSATVVSSSGPDPTVFVDGTTTGKV